MDSGAAAEALSEVEPEIQASILESLDSEKAADIIEEMAPDQAADALAELEEEISEEILEEMETEPKAEVRELLEFEEDTAGGLMNTEFIAVPASATVTDALEAMRGNEELLESLNAILLVDEQQRLAGMVPLARILIASPGVPLKDLAAEQLLKVPVDESQDRVTEMFDKYNLLTLPVVDEEDRVAGVITADDIITVLRNR
jgi:Mg/Co/Ni transporter MgtE